MSDAPQIDPKERAKTEHDAGTAALKVGDTATAMACFAARDKWLADAKLTVSSLTSEREPTEEEGV